MIPIKDTKDSIAAILRAYILDNKEVLDGQEIDGTMISFDGNQIRVDDHESDQYYLFDIEVRLKKG